MISVSNALMMTIQDCFRRIQKEFPCVQKTTLKLQDRTDCLACFIEDDNKDWFIYIPNRAKASPYWLIILLHEARHAIQTAEGVVREEEYENRSEHFWELEKDADDWAISHVEMFRDTFGWSDEQIQEDWFDYLNNRDYVRNGGDPVKLIVAESFL